MEFDSIEELKAEGFKGFHKVSELMLDSSIVSNERGVYIVLAPNDSFPKFLHLGVGGFFKGKDPNVPIEQLKENWLRESPIVYIGQAGGIRKGKWSASTLRKRIRQYLSFGQGKNIGHYGGRLIWQLASNRDLIVCWKELQNKSIDPKELESRMLAEFVSKFGQRPFANLQ